MSDTPTTFAEVINKWPDPSAATLAMDLGISALTVRQWRLRDSIPAEYWNDIAAKAMERGFEVVTVNSLADLAAARRAAA